MPPRQRRAGGFTLVELMVVLALVAILGAVMLPEMRGTYDDARLRACGRGLVDACSIASSRAALRNQSHWLEIQPESGRYAVLAPGGSSAGPVPVRDTPGAQGRIDRRITVHVRAPEDADGPQDGAGTDEPSPRDPRGSRVTFHPDGTADAAEILLRDRAGFGIILRISPVTARVRIRELPRT